MIPIRRLISLVIRHAVIGLGCLAILVIQAAAAQAVVLEMQLNVDSQDRHQLEASMQQIHRFFEQQPGFVRAELSQLPSGPYHLEEEWVDLLSYQMAIRQPTFRRLADEVPGSSNWRAESLMD